MNCASALGMVGAKHLVFRMGRAGTCPPPTFLKDFLVKLREVVIKLVRAIWQGMTDTAINLKLLATARESFIRAFSYLRKALYGQF